MNDYAYLRVDGTWHRATLGEFVPNADGDGGHQAIVPLPECEIADDIEAERLEATSLRGPADGEPRHEACFA